MVAPAPAPARVTPPKSIEEADAILLELGKLDALEARNKADLERLVAQAREKFGDRNFVDVDGATIPIADRRTALETALQKFADDKKDDLIGDKRRFVKLNHGKFGWKKQRDSCKPVDGQSNAGRASLLDKLVLWLVSLLTTFEDLSQAAMACLDPHVTWNRTKLLDAQQKGLLKSGELYRIGFEVVEGEDQFYVEPAKIELESQSAERM